MTSVTAINHTAIKVTDSRFVILSTLLILAWAFVYQEALLGMEAIWSRSDTFAHGYFILPITLWLLWRDKTYWLTSNIQLTWLPLPLLAISLFVGLFSYAADISVLGQLSAVTSLIFLLWALMGNQLAWRYKFPLAYLLFAVPMGENMIPWLQDVTAWFTVFFLKLNDIPVYVDGLYIQIPAGMFEVAVACSGIRYLIASAAVGALFGYLTYSKPYKQILFFIFALFLPILANGIRAYGIVAIAHYSDMKYATGADHLIYGWIFFGIVIMLMFWIGGFFADKPEQENLEQKSSSDKKMFSTTPPLLSTTTLSLLGLTFYLIQAIPVVTLPETVKSVKTDTVITTTSWGISFANPVNQYQSISSSNIEVFRATYANKQDQGELISSKNVLHDMTRWTVVATKEVTLNNHPFKIVHLRNILGISRSYLYQYKVGEFYSINENHVKLVQAWNSLTRQSDFSEINAISLVDETDLSIAEQKLLQSVPELFNAHQHVFKEE